MPFSMTPEGEIRFVQRFAQSAVNSPNQEIDEIEQRTEETKDLGNIAIDPPTINEEDK